MPRSCTGSAGLANCRVVQSSPRTTLNSKALVPQRHPLHTLLAVAVMGCAPTAPQVFLQPLRCASTAPQSLRCAPTVPQSHSPSGVLTQPLCPSGAVLLSCPWFIPAVMVPASHRGTVPTAEHPPKRYWLEEGLYFCISENCFLNISNKMFPPILLPTHPAFSSHL